MKQQSFDKTRPLTRSRTLRGGRLTKWKGKVASIAHIVGVATVFSALYVGTASAANECGPNTAGPTVIICGSTNYAGSGSYPNYPTGIVYVNQDDLTLVLDDGAATLLGDGVGVDSTAMNTGDIVVVGERFLSISTTAANGRGVQASNFGTSGNADASMSETAGSVKTTGHHAYGILAEIGNPSNLAIVTATMDGGTITTEGDQSTAVYAFSRGQGAVNALISNGVVDTAGIFSYGIYAWIFNSGSLADATSTFIDGSITTRERSSVGVAAQTSGQGNVMARMEGGDISTRGDFSFGLYAQITNTDSAAVATATLLTGEIKTAGEMAFGIYARHRGGGDAVVSMNGGTVTASGTNAHGIAARSEQGRVIVNVNAGTVTSGIGAAAGILTVARAGGTIDIAAAATINGAASGIAINDGDFDRDGIDEIGGDIVVTTAGTVTGDAILGLGDDTFNLTGGLYTGSIYGDDRDYALSNDGLVNHEGNDTFNWTGGKLVGGFNGQDGSDVVNIAAGADISGLTLLDGGDDLAVADGFIDVLSVDGLTGAVDGSIITNWEEINVANSDVQVTDLVAGAVSVTDSTVVATNLTADEVSLTNSTTTIDGTSVVATVNTCGGITTLTGSTAATDVLGCASDDKIVIDGDTVIANAIEGAGGDDSVSVLGNASAAIINVAGDGSDMSAATDNNNSVLVNTTGTVGTVIGGDQADAITLTAGTVGTVVAGGGADTIIANGADVTTSIDAGDGDDTVTWSAGTVAAIATGLGSDALTVSASEYDGSQVLDGGDDLSTADGMVDTLTLLNLTVAATGANILGMENVVIDGGTVSFSDGALTTGSDAGTGLSIVNGGALDAGGAFALTGNLSVAAGSTFDGTGAGAGVYSISGDLINNGLVTTKDGVVGDTITVAGNYSGTGVLSVDVNTATDELDALVIAGDVTGGPTTVVVNNLSLLGATGNAMTVVAVGGTSAAGDFVLDGGSLTAGAFDYNLAHQGSNLVLASAVNSTGAVYETAPSVLGAFNRLPTLEQRVGQRQWTGQSGAQTAGQPLTGAWVRFTGDKLDATTRTGSSIDSSTWSLQTGADFAVEPGDAGQWVLGVTGQYGKVSSTVTSALGFGTIDAEGFGVGATATWYGNTGTYVDLQGQVNWIDSDIASSAAGALVKGQSAKAYALSAEVGHRFALNETSALVPQAQLMWGRVDGGSFTDNAGNVVDLGSNGRTIGRLGLAYEYAPKTAAGGNPTKAYVIGNILHDFSGDSSVKVGGASLSTGAAEKTWGEIGVGGSYAFDANKTLYGEAAYRTSFGGSSNNNGLSATVGLRIQW
jgi:outer membrane autotransporter protein